MTAPSAADRLRALLAALESRDPALAETAHRAEQCLWHALPALADALEALEELGREGCWAEDEKIAALLAAAAAALEMP